VIEQEEVVDGEEASEEGEIGGLEAEGGYTDGAGVGDGVGAGVVSVCRDGDGSGDIALLRLEGVVLVAQYDVQRHVQQHFRRMKVHVRWDERMPHALAVSSLPDTVVHRPSDHLNKRAVGTVPSVEGRERTKHVPVAPLSKLGLAPLS
jgi:hypothetical protein